MFPAFLPSSVAGLSESESIACCQQIQRLSLETPLHPDSIATSYVHQGKGNTPIVCLHGFDSSLLEFRRLLPLLAPEREVWAIDLWGFGFTERRLDYHYSPASIATHLYQFWQTAIDRPMILVGASMGGAVALEFALNHPQLVEQLILIDSVGCSNPPRLAKYLFPPLTTLATKFLSTPKVRHNISLKAYHDSKFATADADLCASLHLEMPYWSEALIGFTKSGGYGGLVKSLPKIHTPSLIIWGDFDRILGTKPARQFAKYLPKSELKWIPNAGHVPHLENSIVTAKHILDFTEK
jgi:pimeloyl-ACP methyl ester carboxylesterase